MTDRRPSLLVLVAALAVPHPVWAVDVALTGSWSLTLDAADLVAGAGTDLVDPQTSPTSQVTVDVSGTLGDGDTWRVDVRRADVAWDPAIHVWVRRTGAGSGTGSISGGTGFQEVDATDGAFFSGAGDRTGISLQIKLTGLSVGVQPDTFSSTLVYTVADT